MNRRFSMIMLALVLALVALVPIMVFQGCGSDPYSVPPSNHAPIVSAGTGTSVANGVPVTLAATASDADGDALTYAWTVTQPAGTPLSVFSNATILTPVFTPNAIDTAYLLTLTVNDGTTTSSNSVQILVGTPPDPAPYNASIVIAGGAAFTYDTNVTLTLHAEDNIGVIGYFVSESNIAPALTDAGWVAVTPAPTYNGTNIPITLSPGYAVKTVYVWFKDANANITPVASDTIEYKATPAPTG